MFFEDFSMIISLKIIIDVDYKRHTILRCVEKFILYMYSKNYVCDAYNVNLLNKYLVQQIQLYL